MGDGQRFLIRFSFWCVFVCAFGLVFHFLGKWFADALCPAAAQFLAPGGGGSIETSKLHDHELIAISTQCIGIGLGLVVGEGFYQAWRAIAFKSRSE